MMVARWRLFLLNYPTMFQKIVLFSGLFFLASCQSEVCECADQWLEMTNALKAAEAKGLKNPAKVLSDFRAEIAKLEK